jgi:putative chitinase
MLFDRTVYFDKVRADLFAGNLSQQQVDGQNDIIDVWETLPSRFPDLVLDVRWLAYMLATTYHETSQEMWPIEEYGKGAGMSYGKPDPETGQTYYGRGYVQLTWRDNYQRATTELELTGLDDLVWHAANALDPVIAAKVMYRGMYRGWFRSDSKGPQTLPRYFSATIDDAYTAREIINGDKTTVPSWSYGQSIGILIAGYHQKFLSALDAASASVAPQPEPHDVPTVTITTTGSVKVIVNGEALA